MKARILSILLAVSLIIPSLPVMAAEIQPAAEVVSETENISGEIPEATAEPEEIETPDTVPEETQESESVEMPSTEVQETATPDSISEPTMIPDIMSEPTAAPDTTLRPTAIPDITPEPEMTPDVTPEATAMPSVMPEPTETPSVTPTEEPDDDLLGDTPEIISSESGSEVAPAYRSWYSREDFEGQISSPSEDELVRAVQTAPVIVNDTEAVSFVKAQLKARNTDIRFVLNYGSSFTMTDFLNAAMLERSDTPADEGDYLTANVIYWEWRAEIYSNGYTVYQASVIYTDSAQMEAATTTAINQALAALNLSGKSEFDKIKAIHDYVVERIDYTNDNTYKCHSTYAAIVEGKAVCQGYASLFLRMCKQSGIPARYITGYGITEEGKKEAHAWNIVKLGDYWYNVDTTWDDPIMLRALYYDYFLKSDADFADHERSEEYTTSSFYEAHPMSPISYRMGNEGAENLDRTFYGLDGGTLSSKSDGKPKLIVFFSTECANSRNTLQNFSKSNWVTDGSVDVYAIEVNRHTQSEVEAFRDTYCPEGYIKFGFDWSGTWNDYFDLTGFTPGNLPYIAMIDTDNRLRALTSGFVSTDSMEKTYLPVLDSEWNVPAEEEKKPVTAVKIQYYESKSHVDMDMSYELADGSVKSMYVGDYIFLKGVGVGTDSYQMVDSATIAKVSDLDVIKYDAASKALRATGQGKAMITFTSVSNPEVTARLNITVKYNNPAGTIPFGDVQYRPGHWQYEAVKYASDRGIMTGLTEDEFQPKESLTRAQFASVLYRLAGSPSVNYEAVFADVPSGTWYSDAVIWAYSKGIVSGFGNNLFGVKENITREQIARMLMEYARVMGYDISARAGLESFADQSSVSGWATEYVRWMVGSGMMSGTVKDGKYYLNPKGNAARDECASMLMRFIQKYQ